MFFVNTLNSMNRILMALTEFITTTTATWGLVWFGYVPHAACCVWSSSVTKFPVSTSGKCQDEVITWRPSRGHLCLKKSWGTPALLQGWLHAANWLEANDWERWEALKETICVWWINTDGFGLLRKGEEEYLSIPLYRHKNHQNQPHPVLQQPAELRF